PLFPYTTLFRSVDLALVALGELGAVADAHHLCAAAFRLPGLAGNVGEESRLAWIGDVDDRGAVVLLAPRERVQRLAAVVADVGDPAPAALLDEGLVGAAALQVVVAGERH